MDISEIRATPAFFPITCVCQKQFKGRLTGTSEPKWETKTQNKDRQWPAFSSIDFVHHVDQGIKLLLARQAQNCPRTRQHLGALKGFIPKRVGSGPLGPPVSLGSIVSVGLWPVPACGSLANIQSEALVNETSRRENQYP